MRRFAHIEEAEIIEEHLSDGDAAFARWIAEKAARITRGSRGSYITEGLILADFAENAQELRRAFQDNKEAINRYFDQVDLEKVISETGVARNIQASLADRLKNNLPGFAAGSLAAAGIIAFMNHRNKQS